MLTKTPVTQYYQYLQNYSHFKADFTPHSPPNRYCENICPFPKETNSFFIGSTYMSLCNNSFVLAIALTLPKHHLAGLKSEKLSSKGHY